MQRQLQSKDIFPKNINHIDNITGCDHGKGAFVAGAQIVVTLDKSTQSKGQKINSFSFKISLAEIIYRKANAEILTKTTK